MDYAYDGGIVTRTSTDRGQLEDVDYDTDGAGGQAATSVAPFGYDDGGRETSRTFGNGQVTNTTYLTGEILIDTLSTSGVTSLSSMLGSRSRSRTRSRRPPRKPPRKPEKAS